MRLGWPAGRPTMAAMRVDFHLHTHRSDGQLAPSELLAHVRRAKLDAWAVTDHDTLAGWRDLHDRPDARGLIPGVEATAAHGGREIHLVGLGLDPAHAGLADLLADVRALRRERLAALIARLPPTVARGVTVDALDDGHADALGRNHLARALVERGGVATLGAAFTDHLGDEHVADPSLPQFPPIAQVAAALHAAGAVVVLAHPAMYGSAAAVAALLDGAGPGAIDAMELAHPGLGDDLQRDLMALAAERGLLASAGSDLHFAGARKPGKYVLDDHHLRPLLLRLGLARAA
jgi:predicted metal-dependent phosphoesterase TrpH